MYNKHFLFEANENIQNMFFCPQKNPQMLPKHFKTMNYIYKK